MNSTNYKQVFLSFECLRPINLPSTAYHNTNGPTLTNANHYTPLLLAIAELSTVDIWGACCKVEIQIRHGRTNGHQKATSGYQGWVTRSLQNAAVG